MTTTTRYTRYNGRTTLITAKEIKAAIKAEYPQLQRVGVTTDNGTDTSFCVSVPLEYKDLKSELRAFCHQFEHIDRCEVTGEILGGGNTYVSITTKYPRT